MYVDYFITPLGRMECKASEKGLVHLIFCGDEVGEVNTNIFTETCKLQVAEYFSGHRITFDIALDPIGTDFQKQVWACLSTIPFGKKVSYLDIAKMVGKPKGSQAVGGANGRNPLTIVVPCHRVIGTNGSLTGYAGGIERKLWLLNHEGIEINPLKQAKYVDINAVVNTRQSKTEFLK